MKESSKFSEWKLKKDRDSKKRKANGKLVIALSTIIGSHLKELEPDEGVVFLDKLATCIYKGVICE